jgi:hypothetical protein
MNKKRCLSIMVAMAAVVLLLAPSCEMGDLPPFGTVNYPPIIHSLEIETDWIAPLGSLQLICTASDHDRDKLNYEWTATGGDISGTGAAVNWTAPEEVGVYEITVVVDDGHEGEDKESVSIVVGTGTLPIIENLDVTAKEPKYLKTTSTGYKVAKTKEYYIECIVSGMDEMIYEWSCDGGEMSGEGSMITWTAPNTSGYVIVTVIVFDVEGNMDSESIIFDVVDCTSCTFR